MIWALAQAGNRASKTGHYLQWWDTGSEWHAVTSSAQKVHHSNPSYFFDRIKALFLKKCEVAISKYSVALGLSPVLG